MRNVNDFNDSHDNSDNDPRGLGGRPGPGFGGGHGREHRGPGGFAPQGPGFGAHRGFDRMGGGGRRDRGFGPGGNGGFPDGFGADFAPGFGPDADPRGRQGHGPEREPGDDFPDDRFGGHFRGGRGEDRGPGRGQRPDFGGMGGFGPGFGGPMGGPRGGRGGRGPGRGRKGDVRNAILALLKDQPMNGYQLITAIGEKSEGLWNPSAGSVYPALGLLTDEGLIRETQVDGKKVSELTETGREYVEQHADELTAPWEKVAGPHQGFLDIRPEVGQLAMAVQQVVVQGEQSQIEAVRGILDRARKDIYRLLAGDADTTGGSDTTGTPGATEADAR